MRETTTNQQHIRTRGLRPDAAHYRPDIDGMRAIAVLSVIGFHAFPSVVRGGFVGVDVFFVISGFLISGIIFSALERNTFSLVGFYIRRIRRIFPALTLVLFATVFFGWFLLFPDEFKELGKHVLASAAFANNLLLWRESGYFDTVATQKPLLHLWSLGIEEQFYISYPLLVWWLWGKRFTWQTLAALCLASLVLNAYLITTHPAAAFFSPATREWQLFAGGLLAYAALKVPSHLQTHRRFRSPQFCDLFAAAGLLLIASSVLLLDSATPYPGLWALLPTLGACCIIAAGPDSLINRHLLSHPWMVFIGLISYPLYLWHWVLISFAHIVRADNDSATLRAILVLISFGLAWVTYIVVETPLRRGQFAVPKAMGLASVLLIIAAAGFGIYRANGMPARANIDTLALLDASDYGPQPSDKSNCPPAMLEAGIDVCRASAAAPIAVVWGDSHAEHFYPGVAKMDKERPWLVLANYSCSPTTGIQTYISGRPANCAERNDQILKYITSSPAIQTVVLAFFGNYVAPDNYAADHVIRQFNVAQQQGPAVISFKIPAQPQSTRSETLAFGLGKTILALRASRKQVVVVVDVPELPFFPKQCVARPFFPAANCLLARTDVDLRQHAFRQMLDGVHKQFPDVTFFDPLDLFCNATTCSAVRDGVVLYVDSHHLSQRGSALVAQKFLNSVMPQSASSDGG